MRPAVASRHGAHSGHACRRPNRWDRCCGSVQYASLIAPYVTAELSHMTRLPRFDLAGIPQHVVQRGNNRCRALSTIRAVSAICNACAKGCCVSGSCTRSADEQRASRARGIRRANRRSRAGVGHHRFDDRRRNLLPRTQYSKAPMSVAAPLVRGKPFPRSSQASPAALFPPSIAGLSASRACVIRPLP
jgi:hypothetical protein